MRASGDLVIGKTNLTAETRRRGEDQKPTTAARRHGERSRDRETAYTRIGGAANSFHDLKIGHTVYTCHPERVGVNATASRRTPTMLVPEHAASGSSHEIFKDFRLWLASAIRILRAMLREIFDESAYERFLLQTGVRRSVESYRAFMRESETARANRPRCC